jgi:parvulin-like peptidyl-prolyl isomerase
VDLHADRQVESRDWIGVSSFDASVDSTLQKCVQAKFCKFDLLFFRSPLSGLDVNHSNSLATASVKLAWIRNAIRAFIAVAIAMMVSFPSYGQPPMNLKDADKLPTDVAATIAIVGEDRILLGDLLPRVEARIAEVVAKNGEAIPEEQVKFARYGLIRPLLAQTIQNKMMRESFLNDQVGTENADKRVEADQRMTAKARQLFHETELPKLQKQYKTNDLAELDDILRKKGNSLEGRQREFVDMMLGHLYIRGKVERDPQVSVSEINQYYLDHKDDYMRPTRARWEQLSVLFTNHSDRETARRKIWDMGREAFYGGNLQAIAKQKSEEPFSGQGGVHDWTPKGSLVSEVLDQQIFSIPINEMSEIVEDADGLHIVRVLEREEAGLTSLSEVQDEIRAIIRKDKIAKSQSKVMEDMQSRVPVWSLFPDDVPGALPLPKSVARHHKARSHNEQNSAQNSGLRR